MEVPNQPAGTANPIRGMIVQESEGKIKAPLNIIQSPTGARAIFTRYRFDHLKRIQLYAQIEGLIAGNPPYNPSDLAKHGLGHIANFNNLDGRSLYERGALAYWNLLNETEYIAKFEISGIPDPDAVRHADTLGRHWDRVVRKWTSFYTQVNTLAGQLIKFGISPVVWPDEKDWRWRVIELSRFYVADQALADIEQLTCVCVETTFTAQYLYEVYEEYKDKPKEDSPWNIDELAALLVWRANAVAKQETDVIDMMDLQRRLQNGDIGYNVIFSDNIRIVSLLYKEYDEGKKQGKISHYMFERYFDKGSFLFFADKQYECMEEAIMIFTASPGEFTIHSNRGLGHKILSGCQAMMQLDCSIIDMARWSSTPLIKSLSTGSKDIEPIRFYPGVPTNLGTAEFVQNQLGENINQLIGASQYINQKLQYNTANSGDDPGVPDRSVGSISPSQARMQSYKEFGVLKHNIAHFYSQFDTVICNMVAKMWNSKKGCSGYEFAKEWKESCIEDGVPPELFTIRNDTYWRLPRHIKVRASRVAGDGSTLARIMGLQELQAIAGGFGPKAAKEYKRQWVMATMGPEYINAFTQDDNDADETSGGASLAAVENAIMQMNQSPIFSPDNEQRAHVSVHLALGNQIINQIQQQQMDAVTADKVFTVLVPHLAEHMQFLAQDMFAQEFIAGTEKAYTQLSEYARLNRKAAANQIQAQIRKQQEAQQGQQKLMSEEERKNFQVESDARRADFKVQSQVDRAKDASDTRATIMREKVEKDADNKRLQIHLENANKTIDNKSLPELRQDLDTLNGQTISPYDIEGT